MKFKKIFRKIKKKLFVVMGLFALLGTIGDFVKLTSKEVFNEKTAVAEPVFYKESLAEESQITLNETEVVNDDFKTENKEVIIINNNIPYFTDEEKQNLLPFEFYSELDNLGRCGMTYANICKELIPTEERGEIGHIKPSGWNQAKYADLIDGNYLYNRCHLIAYCLAGENDNEKNLITGTRYLNNELMLPYEIMIAEYMDVNPQNHVLYRVTPVFKDDNLVASRIILEAWSIEDNGAGICFNISLANIQPGIEINYSNGESWRR